MHYEPMHYEPMHYEPMHYDILYCNYNVDLFALSISTVICVHLGVGKNFEFVILS